jgi:hypothetical protein
VSRIRTKFLFYDDWLNCTPPEELSIKLGYSGSAGWNYVSCNYGPSDSSCDIPDTLRMLIHDLRKYQIL